MKTTANDLKRNNPKSKITRLGNNTYGIRDDDGQFHVVLHGTRVYSLDNKTGTETLRTGGWSTHTTKDRINKYALNGRVLQRDFCWYIVTAKGEFPFSNETMVVTKDGEVSEG
jgi:hypothetical protein